jgi:hypothetical protein
VARYALSVPHRAAKSSKELLQSFELTRLQVVGDLWESYVKLLADGTKEGCVLSNIE